MTHLWHYCLVIQKVTMKCCHNNMHINILWNTLQWRWLSHYFMCSWWKKLFEFCMQSTKTYGVGTSCNQVSVNPAMYLLQINLPVYKVPSRLRVCTGCSRALWFGQTAVDICHWATAHTHTHTHTHTQTVHMHSSIQQFWCHPPALAYARATSASLLMLSALLMDPFSFRIPDSCNGDNHALPSHTITCKMYQAYLAGTQITQLNSLTSLATTTG